MARDRVQHWSEDDLVARRVSNEMLSFAKSSWKSPGSESRSVTSAS